MIKIHIPLIILCLTAFIACKPKKAIVREKPAEKSIQDERVRFQFDQAFFAAQREKVLGNYDDAIESLKEAKAIYPQSSAVYFEMADIYFTQERLNEAYLSIEEAIKLDKSNLYYYDLKAQICHTLKRHEEAAQALKEVIRLQPGNPEPYFDAANEYIYAKKYGDALAIYDMMEARFGIGEEVIMQKEKIYLQQGKPDKAIAEVKKLVKLAPGDTRYLGLLAEIYMRTNRIKEGADLYRQILEKEPDNGFAHFGMASYYESQGKKREMFDELGLAFRDPRIPLENKINILLSLIPMVEQEPAIKPYVFKMAEAMRDAHPTEAQAYGVLADLYLADNRKGEAIQNYKRALELDPSSFALWNQYCSLLLEKADFTELASESERGIEHFPNQIELYYYKALSEFQLKHHDAAMEAAENGLALYSTEEDYNLQLYTILGDAAHALGKHEESDKAFDKVLEAQPDNVYVLNNYAYYLSMRKTNLEKAKSMSAKTLDKEPNNSSYLDTYGWVLYQMGDYEEARKFIARAISAGGENSEVLEHMGDVLYKLNRPDEAREYWRKAMQLNPDSQSLKDKTEGRINL